MKKLTTREMAYCALFAALTAVCSQIQIPLPLIPINLAIFAVVLCGGLLRPVCALLAVGVYVLLGLVGIPVFAGFKAGVGTLFGNTGGYIVGYVLAAFLTAVLRQRGGEGDLRLGAGMAVGVAVCYVFGTVWFMVLSGNSLWVSLSYCVLPFLPGDVLKILLAALLTGRLKKAMWR